MPKKATAKPVAKTVKFSLSAPLAKEVYLVGTFNEWRIGEKPLKLDKKTGLWTEILKLSPGRYSYKFVVDGDWWSDPNCPNWEWNEYGSHNSILEV